MYATERRKLEAVKGTMEFLKHTSLLIQIFHDRRPFLSLQDERISEMNEILKWFQSWRLEIQELPYSAEQRKNMFISAKCFFDISSMIIGFQKLCKISFSMNPGSGVVAARVNSDLVENIFCQERGASGQRNNPTISTYGKHFEIGYSG